MTREAWKVAPRQPGRSFVWAWMCNRCGTIDRRPAWSQHELPTMDQMRTEGWRCLTTLQWDDDREAGGDTPWDTCPKCLLEETE